MCEQYNWKVDMLEDDGDTAEVNRSELTGLLSFDWSENFPENDGDFFFSGKLPTGMDFVGIVQVGTHPNTNERYACVFIPPGWRGNKERAPFLTFGGPHEWKGQFSGPDFGLSCAAAK